MSESFKYTESIRAKVEREAMERLTKIYDARSIVIINGIKCHGQNFQLITDKDVYGQTNDK